MTVNITDKDKAQGNLENALDIIRNIKVGFTPSPQEENFCIWKEDEPYFHISCTNKFVRNDNIMLYEEEFRYCPFCNKEINWRYENE